MANETKNVIDTLFKNFNTVMRHMFSGLVAVFLFEIGNSGITKYVDITVRELKLSQGVCYAVVAFVVGNLIYFFSRYVICAGIMIPLHCVFKNKLSRGLETGSGANYIVDIGRFMQYRFSKDFSPELDRYLSNAWGWVHGLGSVAIVFFVIPPYFMIMNDSIFRGWFGGICMLAGVFLFLSYLWHILQLLSMENIAYMERGNARCTVTAGVEVYRKRFDGDNSLDNAKVLCAQCHEITQSSGQNGGFSDDTIHAALERAGQRCECRRAGCSHHST